MFERKNNKFLLENWKEVALWSQFYSHCRGRDIKEYAIFYFLDDSWLSWTLMSDEGSFYYWYPSIWTVVCLHLIIFWRFIKFHHLFYQNLLVKNKTIADWILDIIYKIGGTLYWFLASLSPPARLYVDGKQASEFQLLLQPSAIKTSHPVPPPNRGP